MALGDNLKELLKKRNMTVRELSVKSGVSENTLYAIIKRNNKTMDFDIATKISDILGVSVGEFLGIPYKENVMDTNDVFKFYDSLGYMIKPLDDDKYRLLSRDLVNHIDLKLTWEELRQIKDETWKYLKFTLSEKSEKIK